MNRITTNKLQKTFFVVIIAIILSGCAAPRSITNSGKVTPHKQLRFGSNFCGNISSSTATSLFDGAISAASDYLRKDTVRMGESVSSIEKVALSYSLDPIGTGYDFYIRYGLFKKMDIGYKYASGVHVFDGMYQFMGSTGTISKPGKPGLNGSIGIQYSSQTYDLPFGFSKIQNFLGFDFKRKDILIPLIFSASFGEEEKFGAISFGFAYNLSLIKYGFDPDNIYGQALSTTNWVPMEAISNKKTYSSTGLFCNLKLGYKYAYLITSFAMYYQDYGTFKTLDNKSLNFSGFTFVPTIGLQFNVFKIPFLNKKR